MSNFRGIKMLSNLTDILKQQKFYIYFNTVPFYLIFSIVDDWIKNFETKVKPFVELQDKLDDEQAKKMGKKDPEAYPFIIRFSIIQSSLRTTL